MATTNVSDDLRASARIIYDTAGAIFGADTSTSLIINAPSAIQLDIIGVTTTVKIQSRLHTSAAWKDEGIYTSVDGVVLLAFAVKRNYVRVIRSAGTGAVKVYAQD